MKSLTTGANEPTRFAIEVTHNAESGRRDRYYPQCELSSLLCNMIKRRDGKAACLMQWQIDLLKKHGWTVNDGS